MKAMHIEPQGGVDADLRAWPSNTVSRIECVTSWVSTLKSKSKLLLLSVAAACLLVIALASTLTLQGLPVESHSRPVFPVLSGPSVLSFVAIGDWGRRNRDGQEAVAPALGAWAAKAKAPFVVSVGDNFYDDGVQDASDPLFNASFLRPYDAPSLHVPWYVILGNHDYRGSYLQVGWPGDPSNRWTLPSPFYAVVWDVQTGKEVAGPRSGKGWPQGLPRSSCLASIFIDTVPFIAYYRSPGYESAYPTMTGNIARAVPAGEQVAWIDEALGNASATCDAVMVFGHHPVYSPGEHGDSIDLLPTLKPLLDKHSVDAYVAGHDHTLVHLLENAGAKEGVQYIITGAGSEIDKGTAPSKQTVFLQDTGGFTLHSANGSHVAHTWVGHDGSLLYQVVVPVRKKKGREA